MKRMYKAIMLAALTASASCESKERQEREAANDQRWRDMRFDSERRSREACLASGGMVVESGWDALMRECRK